MLLLFASGVFTKLIDVFIKLIDVFIKLMNKESVLYISLLEYIYLMHVKKQTLTLALTSNSQLSRYGNIKAFRCSLSLSKVLIIAENTAMLCVFLSSVPFLCNSV